MATLAEIEKLTKDYADARIRLTYTVQDLHAKMEALQRQYLAGIRLQVGIAKEKRSLLEAAVEDSPALFKRPRTIIISGIKVGFQKLKGKLSWASEETVVKLIRRHFPEQFDVLVKTTEKPSREALNALTVEELKKIGVTVSETDDAVVIKPTDAEVDKLVQALLDEDDKKAEGEAA